MRRARAAAALLLVLVAAPSLAQTADAGTSAVAPLEIQQNVEPTAVRIGEPFTRTVVVTHPRDHRYELRRSDELGEFEVLEHKRRRSDSGDTATTEFTLEMSAFDLGVRTLPPLTFEVATLEGERTFTSDTAQIEVVSTLPPDAAEKGANLYDIRPPEEVAVPSYALLWALLAAVATALLAYALYRWWKRPRPAVAAAAGPPLPLEVRTKNALDALRAEKLPEQGRIKEFYTRLSDILRGYVGHRYGVEALECTSSELMDALKDLPTPGLNREGLQAFLTESDLVKFAKAQMSEQSCAHALTFAYAVVDQTTPTAPDAADRKLP